MNKTFLIAAFVAAAGLAGGVLLGLLLSGREAPAAETKSAGITEKAPVDLIAQEIKAHPASAFSADEIIYPDVLTASYYGDGEETHRILCEFKASVGADGTSAAEKVNPALAAHASLSRYLDYKDSISVTVGDTVYGAYAPEGTPAIGGGKGYNKIYTSGDYTVRTYGELVEACSKAKSGEVIFIPSDAVINVESEKHEDRTHHFMLGEGVTLASDRGFVHKDGSVSSGAVIKADYNILYGTNFISCAPSSRITGIVLRGPDPARHVDHHTRSYYGVNGEAPLGSVYFARMPLIKGVKIEGANVEIDNCEISGFCDEAIGVHGFDAHIHHNYIHHNQMKGFGYGVCFYHGGAVVECNLFNFNRHSIAGVGYGDSWYTARYNVDMGDVLDSVYDMHGGADRKDGTNIAGKFVEMYNNTFLTTDRPYHVRGVPVEEQTFYHNVLLLPTTGYAMKVLTGERVRIYDNIFGIEDKTVVK